MNKTYSSFEEYQSLTEGWRRYLREPETDFSTIITEEDIKNLNDFLEKDINMLWEAKEAEGAGKPAIDWGEIQAILKGLAASAKELWDEWSWEEAKANPAKLAKQLVVQFEPVRKIFMKIFDYMYERWGHHFNEEFAKKIINYALMHMIMDVASAAAMAPGVGEGIGLPALIFDLFWSKLTGKKGKPGNMPAHELAKWGVTHLSKILPGEGDFLQDLTNATYEALYENIESFREQMDAAAAATPPTPSPVDITKPPPPPSKKPSTAAGPPSYEQWKAAKQKKAALAESIHSETLNRWHKLAGINTRVI